MDEIDAILSNIDSEYQSSVSPEGPPEDLESVLNDLDAKKAESTAAPEAKTPAPAPETPPTEAAPAMAPAVDLPVGDGEQIPEAFFPVPYTVKGTKSWNTKEPYLIRVDGARLKVEYADLEKSFYYVPEPMNQESLRDEIKKAMIQYHRRPGDHILDAYTDFIFRHISGIIDELTLGYHLDASSKGIFLYHIGPLTFYNVVVAKFMSGKYGFCYRYVPENKATRYLPHEFIKEKALIWFEENINSLDLAFDSLQGFETIRTLVSRRYQSSLLVFNSRIAELNKRLGAGRSIDRDKLFALKGYQWFGATNIEVFRRFIGKSIFL